MKQIVYSELESEINALRIGRTKTIKKLDVNTLVDEIFELNLDVCKLKVMLSDMDVFNSLSSIKMPYGVYTILIRQSINLTHETAQDLKSKNQKTKIIPYELSQKQDMLRLVKEVLDNDTASYYNNNIYNCLFDDEKVKNTISEFQSFYDNNSDKDKYGFLAYVDGKVIGFCTLLINGDEGEGVYVGISPDYRGQNLFQDMIHTEMMQSYLRGCKRYCCNTILLNPRSLNATLNQGMKIIDGILNINIFSLLNQNKDQTKTFVSNIFELQNNLHREIKKIELKTNQTLLLTDYQFNLREKHRNKIKWELKMSFHKSNQLVFMFQDINKINYGYLKYEIA